MYPAAPPPLGEAADARPNVVSISGLRVALQAAAPIGDLLAWLAQELPEVSLGELVRAYVALSPLAAANAVANAPADRHWLARADGRVGYLPLAIERRP